MPALVLGPLLRYVGTTQATVWVETDAACEVGVLASRQRTFCVDGHHYALVVIEGLTPGSSTEYAVTLDGEAVWPPGDDRPPPRIVTRDGESHVRLAFGSCRVGAPHREPFTLDAADDERGFGIDALWAYSKRLQAHEEPWPDCVLLMGDQVYADEVSPDTKEFIQGRIDAAAASGATDAPPPGEVANFEEYTRLHRESWRDPDIRWLLSTVPSTMIFDDHDVHDDWNISQSWVEDVRALPWWEDRIAGAFAAYWVYQHIGNLSPDHLADEPMLAEVEDDEDAAPRLRRFALAADRDTTSSRFAFSRDFGRTRLIVIDTRAARVLTPGAREMVDPGEWQWIRDRTAGDFDHLILASTVPAFMAPGIHNLEAWNERVCDGAWGRHAARLGERIRRELDFDHWPAFGRSFRGLVDLLRDRGADTGSGPPPASILLLGGDVHTAYAAEVSLGEGVISRVHQLVCSPFRKPLAMKERRIVRFLFTPPAQMITRALAAAAGVPRVGASWRVTTGPTFYNSIGLIDIEGRHARMAIRRSGSTDDGPTFLAGLHAIDLTDARDRERTSRLSRVWRGRGGRSRGSGRLRRPRRAPSGRT